MKDKIREYINYVFRFEKEEDVQELKQEILANLYDRYDEFYEKYKDEEKAYIETIKCLGDFNIKDDTSIEFNEKPSWVDISLIISVVCAIFGLIAIMFDFIIGLLVVGASISLYFTSSTYLFKLSQYVKKNEKDISKHNMLLQKIFKYMKTCFVFWAISASIIAVKIVGLVINLLISIRLFTNINLSNPLKLARSLIFINLLVFIISFILCSILLSKLYNKLIEKYYLLTGETSLKSHISTFTDFLNVESKRPIKFFKKIGSKLKLFSTSIYFILIINLITILLSLTTYSYLVKTDYSNGVITTIACYLHIYDIYFYTDLGTITFYITIIWLIINILMIIFKKNRFFKNMACILNTIIIISTFAALNNYRSHIYEFVTFDFLPFIILISISLIMNVYVYHLNYNQKKKILTSIKE